jgi:RNA recognition motif-containing protein
MGKRAPKVAPVVVKAAEEETFGYADTVVGYASTETKAPEPEAAPEAEAKPEPEAEPEAPAPVEEDASQGKKEVKRPKRPGLLSPGIAKRQKMNTPTPFPEATDGVGERTDKGEREIFISDLPDGCTIESLSLACYRYGRVNSCRVIERKHFGFVTFADSASAEKIVNAAIAHMNDPDKEPVIVDGRVVMVEYSVQAKGDKPFGDEIRQRALEELERIRDGEIVDDGGDVVKRDMLVYDDI